MYEACDLVVEPQESSLARLAPSSARRRRDQGHAQIPRLSEQSFADAADRRPETDFGADTRRVQTGWRRRALGAFPARGERAPGPLEFRRREAIFQP